MTQVNAPTLFVMIDGLRPDALAKIDCPSLSALRERGASTLTARSVMPSVTLPCHTSIFHAVPPTRHGVVTNDWQPMARPLPGLIDVAKTAGKHCAAIYNWEPLRNVSQALSLDFAWFRDLSYFEYGDDLTADAAIDLVKDQHQRIIAARQTDLQRQISIWMSPMTNVMHLLSTHAKNTALTT